MSGQTIAILGEGITARSVREYCERAQIAVVPVDQAGLIIASPGIPPSAYPQTDVSIISEIEWAYRLMQRAPIPPTIIAVTGTNGKSTVTAMIAHICNSAYAGNIGVPLINYVGYEAEFPIIAVEVSSYQLAQCVYFKPHVAVLLPITPDHLAWHGGVAAYTAAKAKLFARQTSEDVVVYNDQDAVSVGLVKQCKAQKKPFSIYTVPEILGDFEHLPGRHNQLNAGASIAAVECVGIAAEQATQALRVYKPLSHRLEWVTTAGDVAIYNDSKATNPEATMVAIEAFTKPVWLICCGEDKGLSFDALAALIGARCEGLFVFGDCADTLGAAVHAAHPLFEVIYCDSLADAVERSVAAARGGDVILFSPGSSSLDHFRGFEDRGHCFVDEISLYVEDILE